MKQLLAGVVLLLVIGVASFLYRNTVERPGVTVPDTICTLEAKICPDGSSVGRAGPACEFAPCAFPNVEIPAAGISFVVPEGYRAAENTGAVVSYAKPATLDWPAHTISVYRYEIREGETAEDVILANTRYQPADEQATDFSRFRDLSVGNKTFRETVIERFEGFVYSSYFLVREQDVLRFDVVEKGVQNWTDPSLDTRMLPEHQALRRLITSLQTTP